MAFHTAANQLSSTARKARTYFVGCIDSFGLCHGGMRERDIDCVCDCF